MIYQSVEESLQRDVWTPSRLNSEVRAVLEGSFPLLWVEGEISNLALPASGHIYFTLKDQHAQVRCAMFRMKRQHLRFAPQNGSQVLMRCRVSLYEARGEFQLSVEHMEPAGIRKVSQTSQGKSLAAGVQALPDPPWTVSPPARKRNHALTRESQKKREQEGSS